MHVLTLIQKQEQICCAFFFEETGGASPTDMLGTKKGSTEDLQQRKHCLSVHTERITKNSEGVGWVVIMQ